MKCPHKLTYVKYDFQEDIGKCTLEIKMCPEETEMSALGPYLQGNEIDGTGSTENSDVEVPITVISSLQRG